MTNPATKLESLLRLLALQQSEHNFHHHPSIQQVHTLILLQDCCCCCSCSLGCGKQNLLALDIACACGCISQLNDHSQAAQWLVRARSSGDVQAHTLLLLTAWRMLRAPLAPGKEQHVVWLLEVAAHQLQQQYSTLSTLGRNAAMNLQPVTRAMPVCYILQYNYHLGAGIAWCRCPLSRQSGPVIARNDLSMYALAKQRIASGAYGVLECMQKACVGVRCHVACK